MNKKAMQIVHRLQKCDWDNPEERREACRIYNEIDDDDVFAEVSAMLPGLANYDAKGNWVGPVANENGWTP